MQPNDCALTLQSMHWPTRPGPCPAPWPPRPLALNWSRPPTPPVPSTGGSQRALGGQGGETINLWLCHGNISPSCSLHSPSSTYTAHTSKLGFCLVDISGSLDGKSVNMKNFQQKYQNFSFYQNIIRILLKKIKRA